MDDRYDPQQIEPKWQQVWEAERAFYVATPKPGDEPEQKFYMLEMLPYPSGTLHMGHVLNYTLGDVVTHFRRRNGYTVMRPMGFDSFGLPAENAAIREGGHPREIIERNIAHIRKEMRRLGWAIDWDREASAHQPEYYGWTQWLFLKFFEAGLAYRKEAPVNWCPKDQTVVANEYVVDGRCERCGTPIVTKMMEQWFFRVTAYADALLEDHKLLDWPDKTITIQRNWIGRSEAAEVLFRVRDLDLDIPVFTTRADTLFGATFFVVAPEHPLVPKLVEGTEHQAAVEEYVRSASTRPVAEREAKDRDGIFTGRYATNPVNEEQLPIWVADYVLMDYGTGAIMGVPAHDERDFEFARRYDLPIRQVVEPAEGEVEEGTPFVAHTENERLVNSGEFSGLPAPEAKQKIVDWLREHDCGAPAVSYRLRDWSCSRQRYWGCPIPIIYCGECGAVPVPEEDLPVLLPEVEDYRPKGKPPLASNEEWMNVPCPRCGKPGRREADTMDTFVDSSWYMYRYPDPTSEKFFMNVEVAKKWLPVKRYTGGIEHAILHLMYARFVTKALRDMGHLWFGEPFLHLRNQGTIVFNNRKMSKSRGNVVAPDEYVARYGTDTLRLFMMFMGPWTDGNDWDASGIEGTRRFLNRFWTVGLTERAPEGTRDADLDRLTQKTIRKVTEDLEAYHFNTAIAAMMELTTATLHAAGPSRDASVDALVLLLAPFAPHITEELWQRRGGTGSVHLQRWPAYDLAATREATVTVVVQVDGRVRDRIELPAGTKEDAVRAAALRSPKVEQAMAGKAADRIVFVPDRLINIVTER
ncbi:MAG: leucine--tRNA ligase [Actinomycetota bacterium]|nr:leucine--tRNA ligase [Actinomycetota bacterium]